MPCNDSRRGPDISELYEKIDKVTSYLCAVLDFLERDQRYADCITGIEEGREVDKWWFAHKRADEQRRQREAEEKAQTQLRAMALGKLTEEERKALGFSSRFPFSDVEI